jgi:hypothetical protein
MNRRSFIASALAAPLAAVMAWRSDHWPVSVDVGKTWDNTAQMPPINFDTVWGAIDEFEAERHSMSCGLVRWEGIIGREGT